MRYRPKREYFNRVSVLVFSNTKWPKEIPEAKCSEWRTEPLGKLLHQLNEHCSLRGNCAPWSWCRVVDYVLILTCFSNVLFWIHIQYPRPVGRNILHGT